MPRKAMVGTTYMTSSRVARILGTKKRTLHNWVKSGRVPRPEIDEKTGYYKWTLADVSAAQTALQEQENQ